MRTLLHILLYHNIWIALAAAAAAWQTYRLAAAPPVAVLLFFIAAATLFVYSLHRWWGKRYHLSDQLARFRPSIGFNSSLIAAAILTFCTVWWLPAAVQCAAFVPALAAFGYVLPLYRRRWLRDLPFLKMIVVACAWAYVTVLLPLLTLMPLAHLQPHHYLLLLERALWIYAIALPFDLRDRTIDQQMRVKTPANSLSPLGLRLLAIGVLLLWLLLCAYLHPVARLWIWISNALLLFGCIYQAPHVRNDYFFSALIDGLILLQAALVLLC